jgi:hypothetical protein
MTAARALVRDDVTASLPAVVADVVATICAQVPAYRALTPAQLEEVRAIAAWGIDRVLELWVADEPLSPADLRRFRGIGAARALDGRPLDGVLRAYRLAGSQITDLVTELGATRLDVTDAMALARLWMASIDALSEALHAGHTAATDRLTTDRGRALRDLLSDLLTGRQATLTALTDRVRQLGIRLPGRPVLVLLHAPAPHKPVDDGMLDDFLEAVGLAGEENILRRTVDGRAAILLAEIPESFAPELAARAWRGCVVGPHRLADTAAQHTLATVALDRAPEHAFASRPLLDEGDAQLLALLAGHPIGQPGRLVAHVLGDVMVADRGHLRDGLAAFLATGSATDAASALGLHPQTLRYRIRRVIDLTGRDPRRPWDRFVLEAALTVGSA